MKKQYKYQTILFDLDGTILDSELMIKETFIWLFAKYKPDYKLSETELLSFLGPSLHNSISLYFPSEQIPFLIQEYITHSLEVHELYGRLYPNVLETLIELKSLGLKTGIVTTKFYKSALHGVNVFKMTPYIDTIIGLDMVKNAKPAPDGIIKALEILNEVKERALYVGDNPSDILAGNNAGVDSCLVKWTTKSKDEFKNCTIYKVLEDISDLLEIVKG